MGGVTAESSIAAVTTIIDGRSSLLATGSGALRRLNDVIHESRVDRLLIVVDSELPMSARDQLTAAVNDKIPAVWLEMRGGDASSKTLGAVEHVLGVAEQHLTRESVVVSFGGSSITNLAGTCAALIYRGVGLIHIPTTVMGQADGAIGLKQAVNGRYGKNMYGAYHLPLAVLNDLTLLSTLGREQIIQGFAEIAKAALAVGGDLLDLLVTSASPANHFVVPEELLGTAIHRAAMYKVNHLHVDPREEGVLRLMEIGHVTAHAIEAASGGAIHHGEAVAMGVMAEASMSRDLGLASDGSFISAAAQMLGEQIGASLDPSGRLDARGCFRCGKALEQEVVRWYRVLPAGEGWAGRASRGAG